MSTTSINEAAITLLEYFLIEPLTAEDRVKPSEIGSLAHSKPSASLTLPDNTPITITIHNEVKEINQIKHILIGSKKYFLNAQGKIILNTIIDSILSIDFFFKRYKEEVLEKAIYNWLTDIKMSGKIGFNLTTFLETHLEKIEHNYSIQYPVTNLHIDIPFTIGDVLIDYYTAEKTTEIWSKLNKERLTFEEFQTMMNEYEGRVFACYNTSSEHEIAKEEAYLRTCEAIDVLKFFTTTVYHPKHRCPIDLDKRYNRNITSSFISLYDANGFSLHLEGNVRPIHLTTEGIIHMYNSGLISFSLFLQKQNKSELDLILLQCINLMGNALSNEDLHTRSMFLISIVETLVLKADETWKMTEKTMKRFCKIISTLSVEKNVNIKEDLDHLYQIRHKITHKGIRLPIDYDRYANVQIAIIKLFLIIIDRFKTCITKEAFVDELDTISN